MKRLFLALALLPLASFAQTDNQTTALGNSASTSEDEQGNIPSECDSNALRLDASTLISQRVHKDTPLVNITKIITLDSRSTDRLTRVLIAPRTGSIPARYKISCFVKIIWNLGQPQYGTFMEYDNEKGLMEWDFTETDETDNALRDEIVAATVIPDPTDAQGQHIIPSSCATEALKVDAFWKIPPLLYGQRTTMMMKDIEVLDNSPRVIVMPGYNGIPARYQIRCFLKITWQTGQVQYGTFTEAHDENGQVMASFP